MSIVVVILALGVGGLICLALFVGAIVLEIYLSKKESKWLGLILPVIYFALSLVFVLINMSVTGMGGLNPRMLLVILLANAPTVGLLIIYFVCRSKFGQKKQLEKMNIQDLD